MIVDCHTHVGVVDDDVIVNEHLSAVETVDRCIVLASDDDSQGKVNENLSEYVGKHKDKMVGFAFVDPTKENINEKKLASITEKLGLKGIVLYCSNGGFHPAHSKAMLFYELAQTLDLPIFFHNSSNLKAEAFLDYAQPFLLDEVARAFPELKIVIGNMGYPFVEQTLSMVEKHENVFADLTIRASRAWEVYRTVISAYERSVMDKLLFGSGFPTGNPGECMEVLLGFNKLLGDTNLPTVPRGNIRSVIERDTLELLGIKK